jgi:photosystem II stability/assembly factor-like uncharacterized protein
VPQRPDDPIDTPAMASALAASSMLVAVTHVPGAGWVAVGRRGHVLLSDDAVKWQQATDVPLSTDLVSVFFVDREFGWAVGHGGVILATRDGGRHWTKQLDGREAARRLVKYWEARATATDVKGQSNELEDARRFEQAGPGRPFLDVWFADRDRGYAVGGFGLLFATEDGGRNWTPRPDLLSNPNGLHLNAIASVGSDLFIVGEQGLFARFDPAKGLFERIATPYPGSFFGVTGHDRTVLLFGLGGHLVRSTDGGRSWSEVQSQLSSTITSGAVLEGGRFVLASQSGAVAVSADDGNRFERSASVARAPIFSVAPWKNDQLIAVGPRGVATLQASTGGNGTTYGR